jgi:FkbM family methyltransferase
MGRSRFDELIRTMGRGAPGLFRALARRNPIDYRRSRIVGVLKGDAACQAWFDSLENPIKTRRGFEMYTVSNDYTSDWIKLHGQHEVPTERFIMDHLKPGHTFLDIGSNIGYFSLLAASVGKSRVVSFEPQRKIAGLLRDSVTHNHLEALVQVNQLALSDKPATMKMTNCPDNTGHAQLTGIDDPTALEDIVSVVVLDDWQQQNPVGPVSVCKMDAEGAEYQILNGMRHLLERDSPALVIELMDENLTAFGSSVSQVQALLKNHGYRDISESYRTKDDDNGYFIKD